MGDDITGTVSTPCVEDKAFWREINKSGVISKVILSLGPHPASGDPLMFDQGMNR